MPAVSPILLLVAAIGADIKSLRNKSSVSAIDTATRLIQTQKIMAQMVFAGKVP